MKSLNINNVQIMHYTPILTRIYEGSHQLNQTLKTQILNKRSNCPGIGKSNQGGWHSDLDLFHWLEQDTKHQLMALIGQSIEEILSVMVEPSEMEVKGLNMMAWANVSQRGDFNSLHTHPNSVWSGVYYVDDGDDSQSHLVFPDPRVCAHMIESPINPFIKDGLELAPKPGLIVLFPSWLQHSVKPYQGEGTRISIAFNVNASN